MADNEMSVTIENAQIIFRNFKGEASQFNRAGKRNFSVILAPDLAEQMAADGWNVKLLKAREEGEEDTPYIPVEVRFDIRPPKIFTITSNGRTQLKEESVEILDWANLQMVDLIIRSYNYDFNGNRGIKAYLQTMFATVEEDELEQKYAVLDGESG